MSHIAEAYAKDLGVKISDPVITEHFFPGLPTKYVTIHSSNKIPAANYPYWDIVINLVKPFLGDFRILQVGDPDDKRINGVDVETLGATSKQMNYIIKSSKMHVGCDSLSCHVASSYDIPSVVLHFNLYPENSKPLWHKKNKCISISPDFSKIKPSYNGSCNRINEIKPEVIAQSMLDQLNIKEKITFKTVRIGNIFNSECVEIVPNFSSLSEELKGKAINIRGDIHWDLENIVRWCEFSIVNLYTNSAFNVEYLKHMPNLKQVVFKYQDNDKTDNSKFFKALKKRKINLIIEAQNKVNISNIRLEHFDHDVIEIEESHEEVEATKFLSKKRFVSNAEVFNSESSAKRLDKSNNFVYDEVSSKELESLYLYEEK